MNNKVTTFSIRVPAVTRVKLRLLAISRNTTMSKLLDQMIAETWEKEQDTLVFQKITYKANKEVKKLLDGLR